MSFAPHVHVRTRSLIRFVPEALIRLGVAIGLTRLFWVVEPHHADCTAETGVLEVK